MELHGLPEVDEPVITLKIDMNQLLGFYEEINAKAISKRVGIHLTLLSQYVSGKKIPSENQQRKILEGIHALGKELQGLEFDLKHCNKQAQSASLSMK